MWSFKRAAQQATQQEPGSHTDGQQRDWGEVFAARHAEILNKMAAWEQRIGRLETDLALQEKGLKVLELEWQEWFDKFRLLYVRLSKRLKDWQRVSADENPDDQKPAQDAPESTIPAGYGHHFTPPAMRRPRGAGGNY